LASLQKALLVGVLCGVAVVAVHNALDRATTSPAFVASSAPLASSNVAMEERARLSAKAREERFEDEFQRGSRDGSSVANELNLEAALDAVDAGALGVEVAGIACRGIMCRVEFRYDSREIEKEVQGRLFGPAGAVMITKPTHVSYVSTTEQRLTGIVFLWVAPRD